MRVRSEVDRSTNTAHLTADGTQAELIWHWGARLDYESYFSAMATSFELDWHNVSNEEVRCNEATEYKKILTSPLRTTHQPSEEANTAGNTVGPGEELRALIFEGIILRTGTASNSAIVRHRRGWFG